MSEDGDVTWGQSLYKFLRSMKLAIALILFIALTSIFSTFIAQNRELEFYLSAHSRFAAWLIVSLGFDNFFRSFLFLAPSALFFINLSVCTYHRFTTRLVKKARKRFGPDILHVGLLVMIVGGVITAAGRQEGGAMLNVGERINVPGGYVLTLENFEFHKYENGAPKDWISTVSVEKGGVTVRESYPIEVNKPLKLGNVKLYQSSYEINSFIIISDSEDKMYKVSSGEWIPSGEDIFVLRDVETAGEGSTGTLAHFDVYRNHDLSGHVDFSLEDSIGPYRITSMESSLATGLQMVIDPGYYPVLAGLLLLTLGIFLTYIQKIGDNKL